MYSKTSSFVQCVERCLLVEVVVASIAKSVQLAVKCRRKSMLVVIAD